MLRARLRPCATLWCWKASSSEHPVAPVVPGLTSDRRASPGAIGGAAGDAGVEYRRAVAAYAVAHGLAGSSLPGFGPALEHARVSSVALETDDVVDDVRIEFTSGWSSLVQAKRRLTAGKPFNSAVAQWVEAARRGLHTEHDRLVIVTASMSEPMRRIQRVLERYKTDLPGGLTKGERDALGPLSDRLEELTSQQREFLLRCALIHQLEVDAPEDAGSREAALLLDRITSPAGGAATWGVLIRVAGRTARRRGGFTLEGWQAELVGEGVRIVSTGDSAAAQLQRREDLIDRYTSDLQRRASRIDLRGLGATIPPISIEEVNAEVEVLLDETDDRSGDDLLWAFLRRSRMVLTGLPGGGKSTALVDVAARLSRLSDGPFPILASLAEVDRLDRSLSLRDRILQVAVKDLPEGSRGNMRQFIGHKLESGQAALLLDALDETYGRRAEVVAELDLFLSRGPGDVNVIVATRDVAYAQAETLGWPHLRLAIPKNIDATIGAIIRSGASVRVGQGLLAPDSSEQWVESRRAWVSDALGRDGMLRETPLLPTLLALLAIERDEGALPVGRGSVLQAVVNDVVRRREVARGRAFVIGALEGGEAARAAIEVFAIEGRELVASSGECRFVDLVSRVADTLRADWQLASGRADETAEAMIRFWDESGIFVAHGASQTIAPRLLLFAEIGDALAALRLPERKIRAWVDSSLERGSVEPVILAAGISPCAADELAKSAVTTENGDLLLGVTRAVSEGAHLASERLGELVSALSRDAGYGDHDGWRSWVALSELPEAAVGPKILDEAARAFPTEHRALIGAITALRFQSADDLIVDPRVLLDVLKVHRLPVLPRRGEEQGRPPLHAIAVNRQLGTTIVRVADILLGAVPEATELVVEHLGMSSHVDHDELVRLLESRGFENELESERQHQAQLMASFASTFATISAARPLPLVEHLSTYGSTELRPGDLARLDELADLLETLHLNVMGANYELGPKDVALIDLVLILGGFDPAMIGSEAAVVRRRIDQTGDELGPFFGLFDLAKERPLDRWQDVADREAAVDLCLRFFKHSVATAGVVADALSGAPVVDLAVGRLRELLYEVASSDRHVLLVAWTLSSLVDGPEPEAWIDDEEPFVRLAAAHLIDVMAADRVSPGMRRLLWDSDGTVRRAAVSRLESSSAVDLDSVLRGVVDATPTGWTCLSCRTHNAATSSGCVKDGCFRAKPDPRSEALKILNERQ